MILNVDLNPTQFVDYGERFGVDYGERFGVEFEVDA